jgi:fructoselysine 6-kinase
MAGRVRIAAIGEVGADVYLPEGERVLGGISANFARSALRAGADVGLFATIGDDETGRFLRAELARLGLDAHVRTMPGPSATQRIELPASGERVFCGWTAGVLRDYRLDRADTEAIAAFDVAAMPYSASQRPLFEQLLSIRGPAMVADFSQDAADDDPDRPDLWIAPWASRLSVAFVGGRPSFLDALRTLSRASDLLVVLTVGADGAFALDRGRVLHQPTLATTIVDTTGCGDAFQAGFTTAHFGGASIEDALRAGAEQAAWVAARVGS